MTNSLIPYSFTPGTKAKAEEVNANFNALADKIDENNSTAVHADTESTLTGKKTFTKPIYSTVNNSDTSGNLVVQNVDDGDTIDALIAMTTDGICCGSVRFINEDGQNSARLVAAGEDGNMDNSLQVVNINGKCYATCPTYTDNYADKSNKIVTTNYLADHWTTTKATTTSTASAARPAVVVENYRNGSSWYRKWSDGFIEQGGRTTMGDTYGEVLKFLVPFSSTDDARNNYIIVGVLGAMNATSNLGILSYGYTGVNIDNSVGGTYHWYAAGY